MPSPVRLEGKILDFETARDILSELADALPEEIFKELDSGIILQPDAPRHPDGLYIMGQYHYEPFGLGRYISVYYGSFTALYANASFEEQKRALRDVLYHELTHHLESLAGDSTLIKQDEEDIDAYRRRFKFPSAEK